MLSVAVREKRCPDVHTDNEELHFILYKFMLYIYIFYLGGEVTV